MRVLLIVGGWSAEREVSLASGRIVLTTLERLGHEVRVLDLSEEFTDLLAAARCVDFAFIALHGCPGEDGLVQSLLDSVGCPYQGAGPRGSLLAMNKAAAKTIFHEVGLCSPDWELLPAPPAGHFSPGIAFPLFAKPNLGGSSVGMALVRNEPELHDALETIFGMGEQALLEDYIEGQELTCGVLAGQALPPVLIRPLAGEFFTYESKYQAGRAEEICPAPIAPDLTRQIQDSALKAHAALDLAGYSRADFIINSQGKPFLLEVNTLPGLTETSLLPQQAAAAGIDFDALIARLIELGLQTAAKQE